jgi:hypothetical protein
VHEAPLDPLALGGYDEVERLRRPGGPVGLALLEEQRAVREAIPGAETAALDVAGERVPVRSLDDERPTGTQDAAELAEDANVLVALEISERAEQVEGRVVARTLERELPVVPVDEPRPLRISAPLSASARSTGERSRPVTR